MIVEKERQEAIGSKYFESIKHNRLEISYEESLHKPEKVMGKVGNFLNLKINYEQLTSKYKKVTSDDLKFALENYDDVVNFFRNTRYEQYL